jgi:hypothetical protein
VQFGEDLAGQNRCLCMPNRSAFKDPCSKDKPEIKRCKSMLQISLSETLENYYKDMNEANFTSDGCCDVRKTKRIAQAAQTKFLLLLEAIVGFEKLKTFFVNIKN